MNDKLVSYFDELNKNNKIGHAFLIGNVDYNNLKNTFEHIFSDYFFHNDIKIEDNPDICLIEPINNVIKKEQLTELHLFLNNTSQVSGIKIYLINNVEVMNPSSANSLLKILEEPEKNIYAFLITSNINNVIETIKSRCQNIFISSGSENNCEFDDEIIAKAKKIIEVLESKSINSIPYIYQILGKKVDKNEFKQMLVLVELLYKEMLNLKIRNKIFCLVEEEAFIKDIALGLDNDHLIKKLIIINKTIQSLNFNLNISLVIDKLLIDLGRC